jgi:hypothetical protein
MRNLSHTVFLLLLATSCGGSSSNLEDLQAWQQKTMAEHDHNSEDESVTPKHAHSLKQVSQLGGTYEFTLESCSAGKGPDKLPAVNVAFDATETDVRISIPQYEIDARRLVYNDLDDTFSLKAEAGHLTIQGLQYSTQGFGVYPDGRIGFFLTYFLDGSTESFTSTKELNCTYAGQRTGPG